MWFYLAKCEQIYLSFQLINWYSSYPIKHQISNFYCDKCHSTRCLGHRRRRLDRRWAAVHVTTAGATGGGGGGVGYGSGGGRGGRIHSAPPPALTVVASGRGRPRVARETGTMQQRPVYKQSESTLACDCQRTSTNGHRLPPTPPLLVRPRAEFGSGEASPTAPVATAAGSANVVSTILSEGEGEE